MKPLVLCADDFAVHEPASRGIARLAQLGRLSATSAMVLSPRWRADAALLQELRGRLDVGLHLDWTSDFARDAGHGLSLGAAMRRSLFGGFDEGAARTVIERQLDAFEAQWKAPPDHVDGHQHVQQFRGIRDALVRQLQQRYGASAPYLRVSQAAPGRASLKDRVIAALGAQALRDLAAQAHMACSPALGGVYGFAGGQGGYAALMALWLQRARAGDLLMCHPALSASPGDAIGVARQWEFEYLACDAFAQALTQHGVQLARGRGLYTCPA